MLKKSRVIFSSVALLTVLPVLPSLSFAAALEQFKSFVSATQTARGEFSQRLVKADSDSGSMVSKPTMP